MGIRKGKSRDGGRWASGEGARLAHGAGTCEARCARTYEALCTVTRAAATQRAGVPDEVQVHARVEVCATGKGDSHN